MHRMHLRIFTLLKCDSIVHIHRLDMQKYTCITREIGRIDTCKTRVLGVSLFPGKTEDSLNMVACHRKNLVVRVQKIELSVMVYAYV